MLRVEMRLQHRTLCACSTVLPGFFKEVTQDIVARQLNVFTLSKTWRLCVHNFCSWGRGGAGRSIECAFRVPSLERKVSQGMNCLLDLHKVPNFYHAKCCAMQLHVHVRLAKHSIEQSCLQMSKLPDLLLASLISFFIPLLQLAALGEGVDEVLALWY